jgi:hypothetical protein
VTQASLIRNKSNGDSFNELITNEPREPNKGERSEHVFD